MKTRLLLATLTLSVLSFGQQTVTPANVTFSADAVIALQSWFLTQIQDTPNTVVLTAPATAGATSITVNNGGLLTINMELLIDGEAMNPSAIVGNVVTVSRADLGTTAVAHVNASAVRVLVYKSLKNLCKQILQRDIPLIMAGITYPTQTTQLAIIATAQAAIKAATDGAVQ
jgi:hypothetical protein